MSIQLSKGKIAGVALLGVAAVTGVMGIATAASGGSDSVNAAEQTPAPSSPEQPPAPPQSSSAPAPSSSSAPPSSDSSKAATPTTKVIEAPKPSKPGDGAANKPAPAPAQTKTANVRIYNNGTVKGMANQAASDIRGKGYKVVGVGNYSNGSVPTTTVYFRPGTDEEATAKSLAKDLKVRAEPRFSGIANSSPGVIVIITNDYRA